MRFLFALQSPEYLRFYGDCIRLLAERGHEIVLIAVKRERDEGVQLEDFAEDDERILSLGRFPKRKDIWRPVANGLRGSQDFLRYLDPRYRDSPTLRARVKRKVLPRPLYFLDRIRSVRRSLVRRGQRFLAVVEQAIPVDSRIVRIIEKTGPDAVIVSALVEPATELVEVVKCAKRLGLPTAACIASWDNLTNKGVLKIRPDRVVVWNEIQVREAVELHDMAEEHVIITGAQPFDRWFAREPSRARAELCDEAGLSRDRPYVLFVGSSAFVTPPGDDVEMVRQWLRELRESDDPELKDVAVIVRPHPYNHAHWSDVDLSELGDVAVWPRSYGKITAAENLAGYYDTLYYSDAVVGINTSAMIEAAILGKPVHSILMSEFTGTQEGTLHFRYLLPENGGFLWVAEGLGEHVDQLALTLRGEYDREATSRFVESFLRPHGVGEACTPILADAIESISGLDIAPYRPPRAASILLRGLLWPVAFVAKWVEMRRKGKPFFRSRVLSS